MSQRRMQRPPQHQHQQQEQQQTMILTVHHRAAVNLLTRASSATGAAVRKVLFLRPQDLHWPLEEKEEGLHWIAPLLLRRISIPLGSSCTAQSPSIIAATASNWAAEVWSMERPVICRKQVSCLLVVLVLTFRRIFVVPASPACPSARRGAWPGPRPPRPTWATDRLSHSTTRVSR